MGYRQTALPLGKVLTSRRNLARVQWSANLDKGRPGHALLGVLACAVKGMADTALAAAGAQRVFVTRQTRVAPPAEIERWKRIWGGLQQTPSGSKHSQRSVRAVP
jgi:hypothetical protein